MSDASSPVPARKQAAHSVLGVARPGVTRYRPQIIAIGAVGLLLIFTIALMVAFTPRRPPGQKSEADAAKTTEGAALAGPDFGGLAKSYADTPGPVGASPGLTDLPPPETAGAPHAQAAAPPSVPSAPRAISASAQQARQLGLAARSSNPFFAGAADEQPSSSGRSALSPAAPATLDPQGTDASAQGGPRDGGSVAQSRKLDIRTLSPAADDYVATPYQLPRSLFEVKAGSIIPAALLTALDSDLPGEIIAQVTHSVFDHVTGATVLIPQGARLIGRYDSQVAFGQRRALIVWNRIIMPDGRSLNIGAMTGADLTGASGLTDRVDPHIGTLTRAIALSTAVTVGGAVAENARARSSNNLVLNDASGGVSAQASQVGQRYVDKELNRQPTLKVRPGWPLVVLVSRDLALQPY